MKKDEWLKKNPIAHRGMWCEGVPENSLLAFERAIEHGNPVELDVQMLADGTLVVFHDWILDRMTKRAGKLSAMNWGDIEDICLLNTQQKIPRLKDVLDMVDGKVPLLLEMKNRDHKNPVYIENLLGTLKGYEGTFVLSSFDPFLVKNVKKIFKNIVCGQNFSDHRDLGKIMGWLRKNIMYFLWRISGHKSDFFVCEASLLMDCWFIPHIRKKHKPLLTWGLRSEEEYEQKKDFVDNYIFDEKAYE